MTTTGSATPEFREWSIAAVRLLQGVVYSDDHRVWDLVLSNQSALGEYFGRLGLTLLIDEPEGYAFLRQLAEDELPDDFRDLPKLFRRRRLSYEATLLCVLLREELLRFEEDDLHNERCVVSSGDLFEHWKTFFPPAGDEVALQKSLEASLRRLEELKFVRPFGKGREAWEIRRILKARLPASELEGLRARLMEAAAQTAEGTPGRDLHG